MVHYDEKISLQRVWHLAQLGLKIYGLSHKFYDFIFGGDAKQIMKVNIAPLHTKPRGFIYYAFFPPKIIIEIFHHLQKLGREILWVSTLWSVHLSRVVLTIWSHQYHMMLVILHQFILIIELTNLIICFIKTITFAITWNLQRFYF